MNTGGIEEIEEESETASQADTEPLPFENDEDETEAVNREDLQVMNQDGIKVESKKGNASVEQMDGEDIDMVNEELLVAKEEGDGDSGSLQQDNDELSASQVTGNEALSPSKSVQGGTNFSDESELTDEPDDEEEDEEEDDDNIGEEGDEDGDAEDDEDAEDEDDEDQAAEGLAALTGGQTSSNEMEAAEGSEPVGSGLEGLAVIAAAAEAEGDSSQAEDDTDNDSIAESSARGKGRRGQAPISRRTTTRLNEVMVASPAMSEDDEDEEDEEDGINRIDRVPIKKGNREMSSLLGLSSAAKRNTKPGAAGGLLAGAPSITIEGAASAVASTATSRAGSPKFEEEDEEDEEDAINQGETAKGEENGQEVEETGTPAQEIDEVGVEDETTTDEAALRRQEAMEALTKIEIGFAHLRDKLYVERMDEVSKEGEMILEGTHPDLIHLSNLIEMRREKKLSLVDKWFEQQEKQYERVAMTEEAAAWNNWRNEVVELRRQELFNVARKRRRLDREKRTIDVPRPARRHQIFETELIRNPDYDRKNERYLQGKNKIKIRKEGSGMDEMAAYVAFPDLRSAEDGEAWMDMERMGIAGDVRLIHGMSSAGPFYRPDEISMDPYSVYAMEQERQEQHQQASLPTAGTSSAFVTYGPGQTSEFVPLHERPLEGKVGHSNNQGIPVDSYGRPLSPPPSQSQQNSHISMNSGHRSVHRPHDNYIDHNQPHGKGQNRRSPPVESSTDRDVKTGNVSTKMGGTYSPPPQPIRHGDQSRITQFTKYDDVTHKPVNNHSAFSRPQNTTGGATSRSKGENAREFNQSFGNHRHQEHLYSR